MKDMRRSQEQIIAILKQGEAGLTTAEFCQQHGITEQTYKRWKAKYGEMEGGSAKILIENGRVSVGLEENKDEYLRQLKEKYGERRLSEFKKESDSVAKYFTSVAEDLRVLYTFDKVLAVGGTGIVHSGRHNRFDCPVVLKINRPNVEAEGTSMVEREAIVLPTLHHPNIISVLDLGERPEFSPKLTFIVEPFITGSKAFFTADEKHVNETWLFKRLADLKGVVPPTAEFGESDDTGQTIGLINAALSEIATLFRQWASLLAHLHDKHANSEDGYVYLDVKPENVLIDEHLHLTSIDYGSVERVITGDPSPLEVFFTERYAHLELIKRIKDKASSNRVRGAVKRSDLRPEFDYFALGISLLEVLNEIALVRPHVVPQLPLYRSLHFLATRLLDGRNSRRAADDHTVVGHKSSLAYAIRTTRTWDIAVLMM